MIRSDMIIDVTFNFQKEVGTRDPDKYSKTLQEYHKLLWSKPLPNGKIFNLTKIKNNILYHKSELGEFYLSSDRFVPTFSEWKKLKHITSQIPQDNLNNFNDIVETIGSIIIWPSNQIDKLPTINAFRGFNRKISDRFDLTIECIRRYYLNQNSPLYPTFKRYKYFFNLFQTFKGFINFFLLQDAVTDDYNAVKMALPFDNFISTSVPKNVKEYTEYMNNAMKFIKARNKRIKNIF